MEDDRDSESGWPAVEIESTPPRPQAANKKIGYVPQLGDVLKAYAWRVSAQYAPWPDGTDADGHRDVARKLVHLLFPLPLDVETDYELRCLLTKVMVGDGLWGDFKPGMPFDQYMFNGERVYTDAEAMQLGELFDIARFNLGEAAVYEATEALANAILMP